MNGKLLLFGLLGILVLIGGVGTAALLEPRPPGSANEPTAQDIEEKDQKEITTDSGLKYTDVCKGLGDPAKAGDAVSVHYTGWLTNGKKFDSSRGKSPYTFILGKGQVIKGWDEGIEGMKPGGKRKLTIPASLAYGAGSGPGGTIPPNSVLLFECELVKVRSGDDK